MRKILILLLLLGLLSSCSPALSDNFDADLIDEKIQLVLEALHERDSQKLLDLSSNELKTALEGSLDEVFSLVQEAGDFEKISRISKADFYDKSSDKLYALCKVKVNYSEKSLVYTMSFTEGNLLAGLFLR